MSLLFRRYQFEFRLLSNYTLTCILHDLTSHPPGEIRNTIVKQVGACVRVRVCVCVQRSAQ